MKYSELREYRTLKSDELFYSIEVNRLKLLLGEKVTYYSTPSMNGTPAGSTQSPTERIAIAKLEYGTEIEKRWVKMGNAFFFNYIQNMGGMESFLYYLAKKYSERDIAIYYKTCDEKTKKRLQRYARVEPYANRKIKCKKAFFNYRVDHIDQVEAEEYIQVIHADYKRQKLIPNLHPKITRYIAVSEAAAQSFAELTGKPCEVCYNPIMIENTKKPIAIMSATRLSGEKGKNRIEKLAAALDKRGICYKWFIFTNDQKPIENKNIVYCRPAEDVAEIMPIFDIVVQLSDSEGYCYSLVEANCMGVNTLATDLPVFDELNIQGARVDFDLANIPFGVFEKKTKVKGYKPPTDRWSEILTADKPQSVNVTVVKSFLDVTIDDIRRRGEKMAVSRQRADELKEGGFVI